MHKWRHGYLSKLKNNESGITLVELLAALSILSIVILLAGSIHMFGQRHFINQTESAEQANDLSYAMTVMSTDLRKQAPTTIEKSGNDNKITLQDGTTYTFKSDRILKNEDVFVTDLSKNALTALDNEKIVLDLELSNSSQGVNNKKYTTTIYFRVTLGGASGD